MQIIPPQRKNRSQGFTAAFPLICSIPAHTIQQPHKPPIHYLHSTRGHTIKRSTSTDTRYHRHAGRCAGQHSRHIIIRYIRRGQCSIPQTVPAAGSRYFPRPAACDLAPGQQSGRTGLHSPPGGAVKRQGAQRAARNHWRLPPQLFSGFRPITNRGQQ